MPLPLGHTAIGLAICETDPAEAEPRLRVGRILAAVILANLPDVDILFGLLIQGNANLFHRGPTHSLLFALLAGGLAANLGRLGKRMPRLGFPLCFSLVFSHVLADQLLTSAPVSMLWPLQVYWSPGFSGLENVLQTVLFQNMQDMGLICACFLYVLILRLMRSGAQRRRAPAFVRRLTK
jgi:membrane-bound metal-dependent hydrolase YbcI (DUF457 family)